MSPLSNLGLTLVLACGATVGVPTLARAQPADFICHQGSGAGPIGLNLHIDPDAETAVAWMTDTPRGEVPVSRATVTDNQIVWSVQSGSATIQYTLNRQTGGLLQVTGKRADDPLAASVYWNCEQNTPLY